MILKTYCVLLKHKETGKYLPFSYSNVVKSLNNMKKRLVFSSFLKEDDLSPFRGKEWNLNIKSFITLTVMPEYYTEMKNRGLSAFLRELFNRMRTYFRKYPTEGDPKFQYMWRVERGSNPSNESDPLGRLHVHVVSNLDIHQNGDIIRWWRYGMVDVDNLDCVYERDRNHKKVNYRQKLKSGEIYLESKILSYRVMDKRERARRITAYIAKYTTKTYKSEENNNAIYKKFLNIRGRQYSGSRLFRPLPKDLKLKWNDSQKKYELEPRMVQYDHISSKKINSIIDYYEFCDLHDIDRDIMKSRMDKVCELHLENMFNHLYHPEKEIILPILYTDVLDARRAYKRWIREGKEEGGAAFWYKDWRTHRVRWMTVRM